MARWDRLKFWSRRQQEEGEGRITPASLETIASRPKRWRNIAHVNSSTVKSVLFALLPGFLTSRAYTHQRELGPTSYLIALRGVAAIIVVFQHFGIETMVPWVSLPFLGIIARGSAMVCVFFVISGYSLSYKPMMWVHQQDAPKLLAALAGSIFRRYLRLYLPCFVAIMMMAILMGMGLADNPWTARLDNFWVQIFDGLKDILYFSNPFRDPLGYWTAWGFRSRYLYQLWTIPVEYRGSLVVFMVLTGTCMLTTVARTTLLCGMIVFSFWYKFPYVGLFLAGTIMAECSVLRNHKESLVSKQGYSPVPKPDHDQLGDGPVTEMAQTGDVPEPRQSLVELEVISSSSRSGSVSSQEEMVKKEMDNFNDEDEEDSDLDLDLSDDLEMAQVSWPKIGLRDHLLRALRVIGVTTAFALGIFLCSGPVDPHPDSLAIFRFLRTLLPRPNWKPEDEGWGNEEFWYGIGSILLVGAIDASPTLQRPLRTPFLQYLGDMSFGVYVLHPLLLYSIDSRVMLPWTNEMGTAWAYIPRMAVSLPLIIILADWFYSMDVALVSWGYRLQKKFFTKWS